MQQLNLKRVNDENDSIGDVVFIHGLGGSGDASWTSDGVLKEGEAKQDFVSFFPAVLSADFPELDVWTLDYSASLTKWSDNLESNELQRVCSAILEFLLGKGIGKQPLILVCHSLGGIVAKEILRLSHDSRNRRQHALFDRTTAVSFLATPHKGSKWADTLKTVNAVLPFIRTSTRIDELMFDNVYLEKLSKWYRENVSPAQMETQSFYEQRKTNGILVVSHASANPDVEGCDPIPVSENHINICKPRHKNSEVYVAISGLIRFHLLEENDLNRKGAKGKTLLPSQTIVIGIVKRDEEVLMVRRRNMINRLTWQFVAGRLKVGEEDAGECIVREIHEETGVNARAEKELGREVDEHAPYDKIFYACRYLSGEAKNNDSNENSEVQWVPIRDIEQFITTPLSATARQYLGFPDDPKASITKR